MATTRPLPAPPPQLLQPLIRLLNDLPGLTPEQHRQVLAAAQRYGVACHLNGFRAGQRTAARNAPQGAA